MRWTRSTFGATNGAVITAKNGNYGLYVNSQTPAAAGEGGDGIRAYADTSRGANWASLDANNSGSSPAVYANSAGTYSGYFEKDIWVSGNCVGCTMAYVAVNSGEEPLAAGDLVAADGVRKPLTQGAEPVLAVRRATGGATGVVAGRAVLVISTRDGDTSVGAQTAEGGIRPAIISSSWCMAWRKPMPMRPPGLSRPGSA